MIAWLTPCLHGPLAYWQPLFRVHEAQPDAVPASRLLEAGIAEGLVAQFAPCYAGADARAIVSMWTQWYFGSLIVPTTAALVLLGRSLPVALDEVELLFDREGKIEAVLLRHDQAGHDRAIHDRAIHDQAVHDRPIATCPSNAGLAPLLDGHFAPIIERLSRAFRVSPRLLWTNVAAILDWTLEQLQAEAPEQVAGLDLRPRLSDPEGTPAQRNTVFGTLRAITETQPPINQRRVCCLRYLLPGMPCCGSTCPLEQTVCRKQ